MRQRFWSLDSPRNGGVEGGNPRDRVPAQRSPHQVELVENSVAKQKLAMKVQSRLRVICATPFQKRLSGSVRSGSFVACVDAFGNCDVATEGGIPRSSRF